MSGWWFLGILVATTAVLTPVLGRYLASVYGSGPSFGDPLFGPLERVVYRITGVDPETEQHWTSYVWSLLAFTAASLAILYAVLRLQRSLPFNPTGMPGVDPALAFNVAVSFVTNTNWQNYVGEATLSHLSQMVGLTVQNFVSAGVGLAVLAAFIRGLTRNESREVGNFWVDLTRSVTRILLPLSVILALVLVSQGVVQSLSGFSTIETLEGGTQVIPGGPAASQVAIKQLGTNGGGFFNVNSAHPLENPNGVTNFISTLALVLLPFATVDWFGRASRNRRNGYALMAAMAVLWLGSVGVAVVAESSGNAALADLGVDQTVTAESPGGNMEGKEVRFGPELSAIWGASTTATSNGSVNSMHDSFTPLGGLVTIGNLVLGEVSPGGVGVGLAGMLMFALLTVFLAGLMVGRTPEFLGKKIESAEVKLVTLYLLAMPILVLGFAAASIFVPGALDARANSGPHGFSELLYAIASPANNNGSAFAGFGSNTGWYNPVQALSMLVGRFFLIIPVLAVGGSLGAKTTVPSGEGTFPTDSPLFVTLLIGVVLVVAGLTFFPALTLGPIAEALGT
jgi:K+-transporting ATPase ATPase A chain